jgi:small subunit ribosomal protein S17
MSAARGTRRQIRCVVVSEKGAKTVVVEVVRHVRHAKYGKRVRQDRRMHVHDETNTAHVGDVVEITECRPMSRLKHWRLERVVERNPDAGMVSPEAAAAVKPA